MVAIKSREADRFLARPAPHIFLYLLFGHDAGLVAERARRIVRHAVDDPNDPFQLLRIGGDALAADPLRLADEANTIGLFGGRRAIWIDAQGKSFTEALEAVIAAPPRDATIVVEAGALKKDAPLRRLCEREKNAAAIECYPDTPQDIAHLVEAEAAAAKLSISPEAKTRLASLLGQDRMATRSELAKLILYAHGAGEITLDHVEAIVSDAAGLMLDDAVNGAFDGDFTALESGARRALTQGADVNQLLAAALRHAMSLRRAKLDVEAGGRGGVSEFRGPPRARAAFDAHLRAWRADKLARAVDILAEAIAKARLQPKLGEAIALRALWSVALAARAKPAGR